MKKQEAEKKFFKVRSHWKLIDTRWTEKLDHFARFIERKSSITKIEMDKKCF